MKAREERKAAREKKRSDKEERLGKMPEQLIVPKGTDPLEVTTRYLEPANHVLRDMWKHCPAFLVCGGPSINGLDLSPLRHPAVCSMGVNNVAGYAPVKSFVFSDPIEKFHHGIFLNPGIMKFAPHKKLNHRVRAKRPDGVFEFTRLRGGDFPNIFGFKRNSEWDPEQFLTSREASWGCGKVCAARLNRENVLFTPLLGIRLLHYLGVPRIYLLGVDFKMMSGETGGYAFNQGRTSGAASSNNIHYKRVNSMLIELRPVLEAAGLTVLNCNPESHCSAFDYYPYEDAVEDCLAMMPPEPYDLSGFYEKDQRKSPMEDDEEDRE